MGKLKGKLIAEFELRSSGDLFHEMFSRKPHQIKHVSPQHIQGCEVHKGQFGTPGSVIFWNYAIEGKPCVAKQIVEAIDDVNKTIILNVIEGDVLKEYKTFKVTIDIKPEGHTNLVKWTLDYEKLHEGIGEPIKILEFVINITKDIEVEHLKA
ncbi:hypothetical protein Ancab_040613 [Ancistrocladus abbreviatus]